MFIDEDNNIELKEILSSSLAKEIVEFFEYRWWHYLFRYKK